MSYQVAVKRVIGMPEVLALVSADPTLRVTREDSETLDLEWSDGSAEGFFQFVQGELQATTPSTSAARKLAFIAEALNAAVVGEDDLAPSHSGQVRSGVIAGRSTWIGWPILVVVLGLLLAWRW